MGKNTNLIEIFAKDIPGILSGYYGESFWIVYRSLYRMNDSEHHPKPQGYPLVVSIGSKVQKAIEFVKGEISTDFIYSQGFNMVTGQPNYLSFQQFTGREGFTVIVTDQYHPEGGEPVVIMVTYKALRISKEDLVKRIETEIMRS